MIKRSFTASLSYAFDIVLNKRPLVAKLTYCAFKSTLLYNLPIKYLVKFCMEIDRQGLEVIESNKALLKFSFTILI